ncbi:MAG: UvrD-helicase domain-containing protein, partial [Clostridiales bacterium]|nr:UvrD-helicase domain-containing protein [Clostridiales bacterium]
MMINNVIEKTPQKPWTRDQELAINTTDKGVVVSAAAGSGKTAVLIERTIKMLINPEYNISADTLLAVTFTNDAANQMKSKLSQAMIRCLEEDPQNEWIAKQQELLSLANICTIDAFCLNLVKNNINQFELAGNFSMIGDEENKILIENSFEEASEYFFKNEPQTMKILMDNFANENDGNVLTLAKELMKFIGSIPFKNQWKNMVISKLENVDVEEYMSSAVESFKPLLGNLKIISEETLENVLKVKEPVIKNLENDIFGIKNILDESSSLSYDERLTGASKILTKSAISKVLVGDIEKNFKESLKEYKKRATVLKNEFKKLGFYYEAQITNDANRTKIVFEALWKFTEKAESLINEYKLEKNKMYFNDITRMTIELLAVETDKGFERTPLAQKMVDDKLYKIILIDEFQDVNNLQEVIFNCISDTDDLNQLGKNVFVVGDMKQSIYKFRQSNPRIFDKAREYASNEESVNNALIVLKKNFRSRSNIIDFTNFVFENIMSKEFGEVDYCGNGGSEKLELGAKYDENNPKTEILLIKTNLSDTDKKTKLLDNKLDHECKACALKIKKMISDKVQVYISENETRDCRPGDFCILSRTGKKFKDYIQALESVGIKGVTDSVQGFLGAREISLALSLMKIIDNPMQDIPFAAVCLSPVFAFTPDELSKIRLSKKGSKLYQLFLAICRDDNAENFGFAPININDDVIEEKCKNAISILKRLRFFAAGMSLERLIRKLFDVTDFMSIASSFENSQQKRANLRMLIKYASDFEKATGGGLSNFLRYMDNVAKTDNDFNEALTVTAGEDAVAIKTIHKSKGLEYPFVIVGNLSGASSKKDLTRQFIVNEISGVGIKLRNKEANSNLKTYFYDVVYNANVS